MQGPLPDLGSMGRVDAVVAVTNRSQHALGSGDVRAIAVGIDRPRRDGPLTSLIRLVEEDVAWFESCSATYLLGYPGWQKLLMAWRLVIPVVLTREKAASELG